MIPSHGNIKEPSREKEIDGNFKMTFCSQQYIENEVYGVASLNKNDNKLGVQDKFKSVDMKQANQSNTCIIIYFNFLRC